MPRKSITFNNKIHNSQKTTITERKHQNQERKTRNSEELKLNQQIQSRLTIQMEKLKPIKKKTRKGIRSQRGIEWNLTR